MHGPGQAGGRGCPAWPHGTATCSAWLHLGGCRQVGSRACSGRAWPRPSSPHAPARLLRSRSALHLGCHLGCPPPQCVPQPGAQRVCAHKRIAPAEPSSLSTWRDHLCTAGLTQNREQGGHQNARGPGTRGSHSTQSGRGHCTHECTRHGRGCEQAQGACTHTHAHPRTHRVTVTHGCRHMYTCPAPGVQGRPGH